MNEKLTLVAAICIEAFGRQESDNIAAHTIRAIMELAEITILKDKVIIEKSDPISEEIYRAVLTSLEDNVQVEVCRTDEFADDVDDVDDVRTVTLSSGADAIRFACTVLAQEELDPEFNVEFIYDSRISERARRAEARAAHEMREEDLARKIRENEMDKQVQALEWLHVNIDNILLPEILEKLGVVLAWDTEKDSKAIANIPMLSIVELFPQYANPHNMEGSAPWSRYDMLDGILRNDKVVEEHKKGFFTKIFGK